MYDDKVIISTHQKQAVCYVKQGDQRKAIALLLCLVGTSPGQGWRERPPGGEKEKELASHF